MSLVEFVKLEDDIDRKVIKNEITSKKSTNIEIMCPEVETEDVTWTHPDGYSKYPAKLNIYSKSDGQDITSCNNKLYDLGVSMCCTSYTQSGSTYYKLRMIFTINEFKDGSWTLISEINHTGGNYYAKPSLNCVGLYSFGDYLYCIANYEGRSSASGHNHYSVCYRYNVNDGNYARVSSATQTNTMMGYNKGIAGSPNNGSYSNQYATLYTANSTLCSYTNLSVDTVTSNYKQVYSYDPYVFIYNGNPYAILQNTVDENIRGLWQIAGVATGNRFKLVLEPNFIITDMIDYNDATYAIDSTGKLYLVDTTGEEADSWELTLINEDLCLTLYGASDRQPSNIGKFNFLVVDNLLIAYGSGTDSNYNHVSTMTYCIYDDTENLWYYENKFHLASHVSNTLGSSDYSGDSYWYGGDYYEFTYNNEEYFYTYQNNTDFQRRSMYKKHNDKYIAIMRSQPNVIVNIATKYRMHVKDAVYNGEYYDFAPRTANGSNDLYLKYDIDNDTWTEISPFTYSGYKTYWYNSFMFIKNDKIYSYACKQTTNFNNNVTSDYKIMVYDLKDGNHELIDIPESGELYLPNDWYMDFDGTNIYLMIAMDVGKLYKFDTDTNEFSKIYDDISNSSEINNYTDVIKYFHENDTFIINHTQVPKYTTFGFIHKGRQVLYYDSFQRLHNLTVPLSIYDKYSVFELDSENNIFYEFDRINCRIRKYKLNKKNDAYNTIRNNDYIFLD